MPTTMNISKDRAVNVSFTFAVGIQFPGYEAISQEALHLERCRRLVLSMRACPRRLFSLKLGQNEKAVFSLNNPGFCGS